ncbi:MAG: lytic transglycosylase domain-containing protein [Pseudomonadota bacterium]
MTRLLLAFCLALLASLPARAQSDLAAALTAGAAGDWERVAELRAETDDSVARDIIDWMQLRGQQGSFAECRDFVARNADWPGMPLLRQRCEYSIPRGYSDPAHVIAFFDAQAPRTGTGALRYAEALIRSGRSYEGAQEVQRGWLTFNLSASEHEAYATRNALTVKDLHEARLDMLLWRDSDVAIERMLPFVSKDYRRLAEARIALRSNIPGVDALIDAVSEELKDDPGLAFERFLWRSRRDREDAIDIIVQRSVSEEALGRPEMWAPRRRTMARALLRAGKPAQAYSVASAHYLTKGSAFADLEWLSGFIALRYLKAPEQALQHFERFQEAVATPISLGRAGYWKGRAFDALGNAAAAREAYAFGARYQSSFYGQLAAEAAGLPAPEAMLGQESFPDWREGDFNESSVFQAARLLQRSGVRSLSERFFVHLAETQTREEQGQLGDLALELDEPHIALMLAKQAARQGFELYKTYFPIATPAGMELPVSDALALSIARRESEFDPVVISPAGARGLMQLMPGTAREVAGKLGEPYEVEKLLSDPEYNARLGSAYLAELSRRYDGNPVLIAIAYNAGPSRANRWMREYGDPRDAEIDVVDWIENIPFRETRNYVMRVTESFLPYRARLTGELPAVNLSQELKR